MRNNYAYLAGLIDAEGCLRFNTKYCIRGRKCLRGSLNIGMTDKWIIEWIVTLFPTSIYKTHPKNPKHKIMYIIRYHGKQLETILPNIYPYLRIKKKQADLILESIKIKNEYVNGSGSLQIKYQNLHEQCTKLKNENVYTYSILPTISLFKNEDELSYLAGIIDGDGCIHYSEKQVIRTDRKNKLYKRFFAHLTIAMNQPEAILSFCKLFNGNIHKDTHGNHKQFRVQLTGNNLKNALETLEPYLLLKKDKAKKVLEKIIINKNKMGNYIGKSSRLDRQIYTFKNTITNETFIGTRYDFYTKFNLCKVQVGQMIRGESLSFKNWINNINK